MTAVRVRPVQTKLKNGITARLGEPQDDGLWSTVPTLPLAHLAGPKPPPRTRLSSIGQNGKFLIKITVKSGLNGHKSGYPKHRKQESSLCRKNRRSVALALMIPVGCSCRRQDSRNGDNLVVPRFALRSVLDSTNTRRAQLRPQWLDGMSDVLADFLRRLRETHPFATAKIRPDSMPTGDYRPSLRSPWPAANAGCL